jgi:hypothetical protein
MFDRTQLLVVLGCCVIVGCGTPTPSGPGSTNIMGTVTFDGKPLAEGEIQIIDDPEMNPPGIFEIKNGEFSGSVVKGKKKIVIRSMKKGKLPDGTEDTVGVNIIPANYNDKTTLTAEVTDSGINPPKFELKSR